MTEVPDEAVHHEAKSPLSRRNALVLANRHARRVGARLDAALDRLRGLGIEPHVERPRPQEFSSVIERYRDRADLVVVAGGDGTLNAAADGLVRSGLPLGVLPLGTANDLARTLGLADPDAACRAIAGGRTRRIDLGCVNGKHFFNVAGIGLSVSITEQLTRDVKKRWGVLAYLVTAVRVLYRSRPFSAVIRCGKEHWRVRTVQIAVGNGRFYGGGMAVAEHAAIDDHQLDLYSLEVRHAWQVIGLVRALRAGCLADRSCVRTASAREFEIVTRRPKRINTDGEITTVTPARFHVVPQAVAVFVPGPG